MANYLVIGEMGAVGLLKICLIGQAILLLGINGCDPVQLGAGGEGIADDRSVNGNVLRKPRQGIKVEGIGGPEIESGMCAQAVHVGISKDVQYGVQQTFRRIFGIAGERLY